MNLILLTGNDCDICDEDKKKFKEAFKDELKSGEAEITNMSEDEDALQFWAEHQLPVAPIVIVTTDAGNIVDVLSVDDLLEIKDEHKEAKPVEATAGAPTVKAISESTNK